MSNKKCKMWQIFVVFSEYLNFKPNTEEAKRGEKFAIWPILSCRLPITVVSTPPFSMNLAIFMNCLNCQQPSEIDKPLHL